MPDDALSVAGWMFLLSGFASAVAGSIVRVFLDKRKVERMAEREREACRVLLPRPSILPPPPPFDPKTHKPESWKDSDVSIVWAEDRGKSDA